MKIFDIYEIKKIEINGNKLEVTDTIVVGTTFVGWLKHQLWILKDIHFQLKLIKWCTFLHYILHSNQLWLRHSQLVPVFQLVSTTTVSVYSYYNINSIFFLFLFTF